MTDFAIRKLTDIEDMAPRFGLAPDFQARFARRDLGAERIGLSHQRLAPGVRGAAGHRHAGDEEIYVILSGSGWVRLGDEVREVGPMDAIRVAPAVVRTFAAGPDGLELLAFGTHTEDDATMEAVDWGG